MTRTPTTSVTAMTIAARAFRWDIPYGAHLSGVDAGVSPQLV
ncbi:MAG TPA: hypothetical protein VEN29_18165 [Casimicrobiaceae bacterium]|nr:hypothetical protein [Casimicrobiaceae bacterium]